MSSFWKNSASENAKFRALFAIRADLFALLNIPNGTVGNEFRIEGAELCAVLFSGS